MASIVWPDTSKSRRIHWGFLPYCIPINMWKMAGNIIFIAGCFKEWKIPLNMDDLGVHQPGRSNNIKCSHYYQSFTITNHLISISLLPINIKHIWSLRSFPKSWGPSHPFLDPNGCPPSKWGCSLKKSVHFPIFFHQKNPHKSKGNHGDAYFPWK